MPCAGRASTGSHTPEGGDIACRERRVAARRHLNQHAHALALTGMQKQQRPAAGPEKRVSPPQSPDCVPSNHTSTPEPGVLRMMIECVCRRVKRDVSTHRPAPGKRISRSPAPRIGSLAAPPPARGQQRVAPVEPRRQFGRDQTRYQVQPVAAPRFTDASQAGIRRPSSTDLACLRHRRRHDGVQPDAPRASRSAAASLAGACCRRCGTR